MKYFIGLSFIFLLAGCMMIAPLGVFSQDENRDSSNTAQTQNNSHSGMGMMKCGMGMSGMKMEHDSKDMNHSERMVDNTTHSKSYVIAERYCTQCHEMREAVLFSKEERRTVLKRMTEYMKREGKLEPDEYEMIMIEHYYGLDEMK